MSNPAAVFRFKVAHAYQGSERFDKDGNRTRKGWYDHESADAPVSMVNTYADATVIVTLDPKALAALALKAAQNKSGVARDGGLVAKASRHNYSTRKLVQGETDPTRATVEPQP